MKQDALIKNTILPYVKALAATALLLFLPAGTIFYWQAWIFMALFFIPMMLITIYLSLRDPELLKRRLEVREKKPKQGIISKMFYVSIGLFFIISGFDRHYGWSSVPFTIIIVSDILFLAGYLFLFLVFKENKYLAHTIVVEKEQVVVTTGPYAIVRHPMYLSELVMFIFAPLALGSYWAITVNILLIAVLVVRIITEEQVLLLELKGYRDYTQKTKYRLIPGIW
ncbi:MAG: isoprenylcysteine carboxylmethyltransferase family protein [Candidatus Omnitrophica bacterium]|nr:isoprenylcysteine carboxylmethyltransferase family protein [Candidatus Omnitrophota bacterium]